MGVVKKVFKGAASLVGGFLGKATKAPKAPPPAKSATTGTASTGSTSAASATDIAAREEEDRRKRLLALNAGGNMGQMTQAGGDTSAANIARKTLLGQ